MHLSIYVCNLIYEIYIYNLFWNVRLFECRSTFSEATDVNTNKVNRGAQINKEKNYYSMQERFLRYTSLMYGKIEVPSF